MIAVKQFRIVREIVSILMFIYSNFIGWLRRTGISEKLTIVACHLEKVKRRILTGLDF